MTRNRRKHRGKANCLSVSPAVTAAATRHGIFLLPDKNTIEILDASTGKCLSRWHKAANSYFWLNDVSHPGTIVDALDAVLYPYELFGANETVLTDSLKGPSADLTEQERANPYSPHPETRGVNNNGPEPETCAKADLSALQR
jgi:hypothetical protein